MSRLTFFVPGKCAPQGSKKHVGNGVMVEMSKNLKPWRDAIVVVAKAAKRKQGFEMFTGPVGVEARFVFKRPQKGHRDEIYKPSTPDKEKLERALFDALTTAGIWKDDALVADGRAIKLWKDDEWWPEPGVKVEIWELAQPRPSGSIK